MRQIIDNDNGNLLIWDDEELGGRLQLNGNAVPDGNGYLLAVGGRAVFRLEPDIGNAANIWIYPVGDVENKVLIHNFRAEMFGITLNDERPIAPGDSTIVTRVNDITNVARLDGTDSRDDINADCARGTQPDYCTYSGVQPTLLDDVIYGHGGDDQIQSDGGGRGTPPANLHLGKDIVYGGAGGDEIITETGDDIIDAGSEDDRVYPGAGNNHVSLGEGNDVYVTQYRGDAGANSAWKMAHSTDTNVVDAGSGDDQLYLGNGTHHVDSGSGNDQVVQVNYADGGWAGARDISGLPSEELSVLTFIYDSQGDDRYTMGRQGNMYITDGQGTNRYTLTGQANGARGELHVQGDFNPNSALFIGTRQLTQSEMAKYPYQYNRDTGQLTIRITQRPAVSSNEEATLAAQTTALEPDGARFVIHQFYNGMFGLTGIEGAPDLAEYDPANPFYPIAETELMQLFLPQVRQISHSPAANGVHPLHAARPEVTAYVAPSGQSTVFSQADPLMGGLTALAAVARWQAAMPGSQQNRLFRHLREGSSLLCDALQTLGDRVVQAVQRLDQQTYDRLKAHGVIDWVEAQLEASRLQGDSRRGPGQAESNRHRA